MLVARPPPSALAAAARRVQASSGLRWGGELAALHTRTGRSSAAAAAAAAAAPACAALPPLSRGLHGSCSLLREQFNRDKEQMKRKREKALDAKKRDKARAGGGDGGEAGGDGGVSVAAMEARMGEYVESMRTALSSVSAGRVLPSLLDSVCVSAHGQSVPLRTLAGVSARGAQALAVQLYDPSLLKEVDRAIRLHNPQLNPTPDPAEPGALLVAWPRLTKDARGELAKQVARRAEETRGHVRDVRQKWLAQVRALEKKGECSEDAAKQLRARIQAAADAANEHIKRMADDKDREIRQG